MKIGIFDSGLGGLQIMRGIAKALPRYDYVYLGDTQRVPYGNRSQSVIYEFTRQGIDALFRRGCALIIVACNTASAQALRRIQRVYVLKKFPDRKVIGVIIPTAEVVAERRLHRVGVIGTVSTIASGIYRREINKRLHRAVVIQQATPLLVSMVESGDYTLAKAALKRYLRPLAHRRIEALVLGCTHYPVLKKLIRPIVGREVIIISQDEIIPPKLKEYLEQHPEIERRLTRRGRRYFLATDITPQLSTMAKKWFGRRITFELVDILSENKH